jgi:hypothetical protein
VGDDQSLDLVCAFVDLCCSCVTKHALDYVVAEVAVAAEDLHRIVCDGDCGVACKELRHGGRFRERCTVDVVVEHSSDLLDKAACGSAACSHAGKERRDELVLDDRFVERLAAACVVERERGRALGDTERLGGDAGTRAVEDAHGECESVALGAEPVLVRDETIRESQFAGRLPVGCKNPIRVRRGAAEVAFQLEQLAAGGSA